MGKKNQLSLEMREKIINMNNRGFTVTATSTILGYSKSCISRIISRYKSNGISSVKSRSGRPKAMSKRCENLIKRMVQQNPSIASSEIRSRIPNPLSVSSRTIRRRLEKNLDLKCYKPAKTPLLSKKNLKDRLAFCEKYKNWQPEDWDKVMFSDESMICQFSNFTSHVRRPKNMRYDPKYTTPTVKNPPRIMVWGAITANGRSGLWFLPPKTTMNGKTYLSVLKEKLPVFMKNITCCFFTMVC